MKKALKNSLLLLGMGFALAALVSRWPEIQPRLAGTNWLLLGGAAAGLLIYQFLNAGVWSLVLGSLGHRVPFVHAARVWLQSEALRWLPGGIWGYGSRVLNAKELGVEKGRASTSLILELALTNCAWALAASLLLFSPLATLAVSFLQDFLPSSLTPSLVIVVVASVVVMAALALLALFFFSKHRLGKTLFRKLMGFIPWRELRPKLTLQTTFAYVGLCIFNGFLLWLVITAVPNLSVQPLVAVGIGGAAWLVGFWALGVPGGIGVREGALAVMLAAFGDLDSGIAVAVLWRGVQVFVELISLCLVALPFYQPRKTLPDEATTASKDKLPLPELIPLAQSPLGQRRRFHRFRLLNML